MVTTVFKIPWHFSNYNQSNFSDQINTNVRYSSGLQPPFPNEHTPEIPLMSLQTFLPNFNGIKSEVFQIQLSLNFSSKCLKIRFPDFSLTFKNFSWSSVLTSDNPIPYVESSLPTAQARRNEIVHPRTQGLRSSWPAVVKRAFRQACEVRNEDSRYEIGDSLESSVIESILSGQ